MSPQNPISVAVGLPTRGEKAPATAALMVAAVLLAASACSRSTTASLTAPTVPVSVATVEQKTVPVEVRGIGSVEAYSTVSIKAQVAAELTAVHFQEGQDVRAGDLLFSLDRRPFEAALRQAEANLARDIAQAEQAHAQARRYVQLREEGVAAEAQTEQFEAEARALDATVQADRAAVERARLNLEYCTIRSPLDGRTGRLMVNVGNLVKASDDPALVVINQITPIYASFALPEQYLGDVKKYMAAGTLKVEAAGRDDPARSERGRVSFVDNTVDTTTGTIRLKGVFPNAEKRLWPGQFVDVVLTLTETPNAIVVPAQALQESQAGEFVYVVKADGTVESRPVETGQTVAGLTIVKQGLHAGEIVVTDGQLRLIPGAKVKIVEGNPAAPAGNAGTP